MPRSPVLADAPQLSRRGLVLGASGAGLGALLGSGLSALACGPEPVPDRRRELLRSWTHDFLLAHYAEFGVKLEELSSASVPLEAAPDAEKLRAAQTAWRAARRPWKEAELFKFGPVVDEPLRFGSRIDFWPARPDAIESVLGGSDAIDLETLGAAAKGLPVVEYLLFGDGALDGFREASRRYEYLRLLLGDLEVQARALAEAWDPRGGDYQRELVEAGRGSATYDTLSMALSEVVNRMGFTVENIRADKLGAGIGPDGTPQPELLESVFSGRSIADIHDNLTGIETLFFGDPAARVLALDDYLVHRGFHLAGRMRAELTSSRAALDRINLPLSVAIDEEQPLVREAIDRLAALQRLIQVDVIGALSLNVRFNDNDGD
ncbi:MAG TPA: imelysin family protein [Polyangiaceae bacterium]|nr:imelysin family protein [Polyangiaceae bacterium]